ncbi:hypothetical protein [Nocardia gipuzkoensis]|uniref:hypothetical protein n=1 Tax=Nocardia gipuzkoensis TaxID=2749991 RepID=UPI00237DDB0D|nr:hypothetical protein [Nocardia gipuzkoensis]MDE1674339.1 hypothetical protein [Nocardia gipuzkoensis]
MTPTGAAGGRGDVVVLPQYRYICSKCTAGWHDTPFCPHESAAGLGGAIGALVDVNYWNRQREKQMVRDGLIPPPSRFRFRWWWIPLGLAIYIVLLILI